LPVLKKKNWLHSSQIVISCESVSSSSGFLTAESFHRLKWFSFCFVHKMSVDLLFVRRDGSSSVAVVVDGREIVEKAVFVLHLRSCGNESEKKSVDDWAVHFFWALKFDFAFLSYSNSSCVMKSRSEKRFYTSFCRVMAL